MRIRLDWRNPTQEHAQVAVFVNGGLCGVLTVRQEDVVGLSQILRAGCAQFSIDQFEESGDPGTLRAGAATMRYLLCAACCRRYPAGTHMLYPASELEPAEFGRLVLGKARQPTQAQRTVHLNGRPLLLTTGEYTCDACSADIKPGDPAGAQTIWHDGRSEPMGWEGEYLQDFHATGGETE